MNNQDPKRVVTGKSRLSYVHLYTPHASPSGGEPKFSVTLLIPKSDIATKQRIDAAMNAAIQQGVAEKWNGIRPPVIAFPVYDGDGTRPSDGMPFGEECKGHWVLTASSKQKPEVVDVALNPIINQSEVYSGMYARVSIRFFPYTNSGKKGIGCGLGNVQKLEDGEPLGGRASAATDFADAGMESYATPAYAQPTYQQPAYPQQPVAPAYGQPPAYQPGAYPQQTPPTPAYNQPQATPGYPQQPQQPQQPQIDPITGKPIVGGVYGL